MSPERETLHADFRVTAFRRDDGTWRLTLCGMQSGYSDEAILPSGVPSAFGMVWLWRMLAKGAKAAAIIPLRGESER